MGMPGNPAPVPISIKLLASPIGEDLNIFIQSIKCFFIISSSSTIAVRFIFLFHSCIKFL